MGKRETKETMGNLFISQQSYKIWRCCLFQYEVKRLIYEMRHLVSTKSEETPIKMTHQQATKSTVVHRFLIQPWKIYKDVSLTIFWAVNIWASGAKILPNWPAYVGSKQDTWTNSWVSGCTWHSHSYGYKNIFYID